MKIALEKSKRLYPEHEPEEKRDLRCFSCERKIGHILIDKSEDETEIELLCICGETSPILINGKARFLFEYEVDMDFERTNSPKETKTVGILKLEVKV